MATIFVYTSPALGNLYPLCALLTELRQRGHDIHVRTLSRGVAVARELGFSAEPMDPRIEAIPMTDWTAPNPRTALKTAFDVFGRRAPCEAEEVATAVAALSPDALIVDPNCWGAAVAADACRVPWASFWPYIPYLRATGVPPFGPGLRPRAGLWGRLRDAALRPAISSTVSGCMLPRVNEIRRQLSLMPVRTVDEFLCLPSLTIVASSEPFDYPRVDGNLGMHLIGHCEFDPPTTADMTWLNEIDRPIVLVSTSSERQNDAALGIAALQALADEPVHTVATFPCGVPDGIEIPTNATVAEVLPHGRLLERAVCAITHGGMGVTQKALARGVPVCVVPYGRDQFEVARRVEVSGCGTRLPAPRLTAQRLKSAYRQALSMSGGARRVAEGFAAAGGVARGADWWRRYCRQVDHSQFVEIDVLVRFTRTFLPVCTVWAKSAWPPTPPERPG